ncbi:hypothetical protein [Paenibacillus oryzisoli]|uniref:Uncharacterized protein n=1 Tax=Paenibacillus oryzisoli TaxID=1850517 RepID=A0A198AJ77_9BACL|nr:hypothetical protein [Paenibacillus oryzisoli]OAS21539.1 hypothetical protein A8708_16525 [Paenibacillus oryzisoli]
MVNSFFMIGSLIYGIFFLFHLLKKSSSDAILMLVLCCFIGGYFAPYYGEKWPTVESLYNILYTPISAYINQELLKK